MQIRIDKFINSHDVSFVGNKGVMTVDFQDFYNLCYAIGRHKDIYVISPGDPERSNLD